MKIEHAVYDKTVNSSKLDNILSNSDNNYETKKNIPARSSLTYENGFNISATVLYVDIRSSKELADKHQKPVLAKIHRAYISETIAVLRDNKGINEVFIEGDGVWAVFDTPFKTDLQSVFETARTLYNSINVLNQKLKAKRYSQIKIGIGIDYGEMLYMQAGYSGSGVNEVVWIGKTVGRAAELCNKANKDEIKEIVVSGNIYCNLTKDQQSLIKSSIFNGFYHGIFEPMNMLGLGLLGAGAVGVGLTVGYKKGLLKL